MQQQSSENTDNTLEWFAENLPPEYLNHPEYFLYSTALDVQKMEDIPENRGRFKQLLVERQAGEGIELPEVDQEQLHDFMNPNDSELKLQRSEALLELTTKHLEQTQDFSQAQRSAILELFHKEAPFRQAEMDETYFRNREFVEADLRAFLGQAKGDSINNLNTSNPRAALPIRIQSGELVRWETYLNRASTILLKTTFKKDNPHRCSDVINELLRVVGLNIPEPIPIDKEYFSDPEYVKADLDAYLEQAKGDSLKDLHTQNPKPTILIISQSGKQITWNSYLRLASSVLFGTKSRGNNLTRPSDALKTLLKIVGVDTPEYIPMDEKYFNNPEYVKADLFAFLEHANGDSLTDLNTNNPGKSVSVLTKRGDQVTWPVYLRRASSVLFGTQNASRGKKSENPHRTIEALRFLTAFVDETIPEYIPMDEKYFSNPIYVKADLNAYLEQAKGESIDDPSTKNPKTLTFILTKSGERVNWRVYLSRASAVLFGTTFEKHNFHRLSFVKRVLTAVAKGEDIPEYILMDEKYFRNPIYVKADLLAFLEHTNGDSLTDLNTSNPKSTIRVNIQSGEQVSWLTYLRRVSKVLFGTRHGCIKTNDGKPHRPVDALSILLKIVGVKLQESLPMNVEYFNNPKIVKKDLYAYLQCAKGDLLTDLHTANPKRYTSVKTQSSEMVSWSAYLSRASGVFFDTKHNSESKKSSNPPRRFDALKKLIQIASQADACENAKVEKSESQKTQNSKS